MFLMKQRIYITNRHRRKIKVGQACSLTYMTCFGYNTSVNNKPLCSLVSLVVKESCQP